MMEDDASLNKINMTPQKHTREGEEEEEQQVSIGTGSTSQKTPIIEKILKNSPKL